MGDYKVLLTTSWDSILNIYDEEQPEDSKRLRTSVGAHFEEDITCMGFSSYLSLIATGSSHGSIAVSYQA
jgi:WD40 repeat protein